MVQFTWSRTPDYEVLRDMIIGAGVVGVLAPLMAIGWWNGVSRKPASPALVKGIWFCFGALGVLTSAAGVLIGVVGLRMR
jgi:hypothetical protein